MAAMARLQILHPRSGLGGSRRQNLDGPIKTSSLNQSACFSSPPILFSRITLLCSTPGKPPLLPCAYFSLLSKCIGEMKHAQSLPCCYRYWFAKPCCPVSFQLFLPDLA
ncbi:hypothetical protein SLA2020_236000 [Shorea laevis]